MNVGEQTTALSASEDSVPHSLKVLKVDEDILFADLANMASHLKKTVEYEEFTLVDVENCKNRASCKQMLRCV